MKHFFCFLFLLILLPNPLTATCQDTAKKVGTEAQERTVDLKGLPHFPEQGEPLGLQHKDLLGKALEGEVENGWIYNVPDLLSSYVENYYPGIRVSQYKGALLLVSEGPQGRKTILKPLGVSEKESAEIIDSILSEHSTTRTPIVFDGIPPGVAEKIRGSVRKTVDEGNVTFLYDAKEQAELPGGKFKNKRRHANKFQELYPQAETIDLKRDPRLKDENFKKELFSQIAELNSKWADDKKETASDKEHVEVEAKALVETLNDLKALDLEAIAIMVDGKVVAISYGAKKSKDTFVSLYDKADRNYEGVYPRSSQLMAQKALELGFKTLDYQSVPPDDVAPDGTRTNTLRENKLSWKPTKILDWYKIERARNFRSVFPDANLVLSGAGNLVSLKASHARDINKLNEETAPSLSIYPFFNLWAFKLSYQPHLGAQGESLLVHLPGMRPNDRNIFLEPMGGDVKARAQEIARVLTLRPTSGGKPNTFLYVSEDVAKELKDHEGLLVREVPEKSEYVYESKNLAFLQGKTFRTQRQDVQRFFENYPDKGAAPRATYVDLHKMSRQEWKEFAPKLKAFLKEWQINRKGSERQDFKEEMAAVERALDNFKGMGLKGGALLVDGKVVAFTLGRELNGSTHVVYTEKALDGAYKPVAHRFALSTMKESLEANPSVEAQEALRKWRSWQELEGLENLSEGERSRTLKDSVFLKSEEIRNLFPLAEALKASRGLTLEKALTDPHLFKVWKSLKVGELQNALNKGKDTSSKLLAVQEVLQVEVEQSLSQVGDPIIRYINRQEDGGEPIHRAPKERLKPIKELGKNYSVQSREVPPLEWNIYESEK